MAEGLVESAAQGLAGGLFGKSAGSASIKIDGKRVPLCRDGLERAQGDVGVKMADAVREAVERAGEN